MDIFTAEELDSLYTEAEKLIGRSTTVLDDSIRQQLVLKILSLELPDRLSVPLPIAAKLNEKNRNLLHEWLCKKLEIEDSKDGVVVNGAIVKDLEVDEYVKVKAKKYVICGGPILTPQLLYASGFGDSQNPHYLPALRAVETDRWKIPGWKEKVQEHHRKFPKDPLPFPFRDLDPQVTLVVDRDHKWHTQIHRDAFSYGAAPPAIDKRTVIDLRYFGKVEPIRDNYVTFDDKILDGYSMPQPTFRYKISEADKKISHEMMKDMETVAAKLGGYLPGSEPQFLKPGLALHLCGTTRAGKDKKESCCTKDSVVHGHRDIYVGGLNVIPNANCTNPTLTAMCFAIQGVNHIIKALKPRK
ncbi:predicted protein [Uncinocarpus reesii 1704]|uniref:Glucose-methanol-choline oxidoreductase C-terminal domain-containing protein n=1 Tax=Uncinocarpus reesii (strain UAMH 1704) TaxID=336963 RepID=C4JJ11_UNCRE|nr:uncharacterized protein UREG_01618 [Uncinocarpus reesii 1704]EEP76769.1 predicted protein [Uncinocarpus reesii 1704]